MPALTSKCSALSRANQGSASCADAVAGTAEDAAAKDAIRARASGRDVRRMVPPTLADLREAVPRERSSPGPSARAAHVGDPRVDEPARDAERRRDERQRVCAEPLRVEYLRRVGAELAARPRRRETDHRSEERRVGKECR